MKIVVVGGTGLVGQGVVAELRKGGHEVVVAAPSTGVDTLSGAGVDAAMAGAGAVLDVTNAPDMSRAADFFAASTATLLAAERRAGVRHHVLLSIVGVDRDHGLAYYTAKLGQEEAVRAGGVPFTIVRATQFFEFLRQIVDWSTQGDTVRLPRTGVQPLAVADLQRLLAELVTAAPVGDVVEVAGPRAYGVDDFARRLGTGREVVTDDSARPFLGAALGERVLLPGPAARLTRTTLDAWLGSTSER